MTRFARWTAVAAAALLVTGCGGGPSDGGTDEGAGTRDGPSAAAPSSAGAPVCPPP